jgi:uncharacterized membrane protein YcaP (DUF421 family)
MEIIHSIFGEGKDLLYYQICSRGVVIFFTTLLMIRLAGQRTFGKKTAVDNVVVIILGALLSRGIVGASPFFGVIAASFAIILLHRLISWICVKDKRIDKLINGDKYILFKDGFLLHKNLNHTLVSQADINEGVRLQINTDQLDDIKEITLERSGKISVIKKEKAHSL